mmetsp:Transcript_160433/g.293063  ORF Transcript_160433/g.293063 Transcript_160433/m.293063 type:complete len:517 (-) Transcript_160433:68-1618(-)
MMRSCRWLLLPSAAFWLAVGRGAEARDEHPSSLPESGVAVISVNSPAELGKAPHAGYFASFSASLEPRKEYTTWTPPADNAEGCSPYKISKDRQRSFVAVVRRYKCSFDVKAAMAEKAGAMGVIVVWDDDKVGVMGGNVTSDNDKVFALSVKKSFGDMLISWNVEHDSSAVLSFEYYLPGFDLSEALVPLIATVLVVLGAYFSTSDMRAGSPLAPSQEEVLEIDCTIAIGWFVMGSVMLMVLFFFMKYMIYVIIACFCLGGASCIAQIVSSFLQYQFPTTKLRAFEIPVVGPVCKAEVMSLVPAGLMVVGWLLFKDEASGWIFQDIIGAGFLCMIQRTLRLPNLWVASILLTAMFFFDIFWVFISPLIFQSSVMVTVAKGGGTGQTIPMLLRIPSISDPIANDKMLGFGDVALPGLLISYLLRYDNQCKRKRPFAGYFVPSVIGYFIGLCVTIVALMIMKMGQPALLYLVPGTLGTTLALAWRRGETSLLWSGTPLATDGAGDAREALGNPADENL